MVDLLEYFHDQDGDHLTHSAMSSDPGTVAAGVSGSVATLRALSQGVVTIIVTATDPGGLSARQSFEVTVPNRGPQATRAVLDMTVEAGDSAAIALSGHFADPDDDALTFAAISSDTSVAGVAVAGDSVRVQARAKGATTITVTVRDPGGLEAEQAFTVTVPNRGPVIAETLPDRMMRVGDTVRVDVSPYFSDPDGDSVGFWAVSSEARVATVAVSEGTLTLVAVTSDSATITVTASDPEGLSVAQAFTVLVPNRAPEALGTISDTTVTVGDTISLLASRHFRDPDGDSLSFTVRSSRRIRVAATVNASTVTLAAASAGSSNMTLTARDPDGLSATQRFHVTVEPPRFPDLVVESPAVDADSIAPGATFTLSAVVHNQGDGDAPSPTTLRFFLSYDPAITTADAQVDTFPVPRLDAGGSSAASVTVTGPTDPGIYFYGACALPLENESDTRNNCSAGVQLRVWQPNRAPRAVGAIRTRPVDAGASISLDVAPYFKDPDEDTLAYAATSSAPSIATASAAGSAVTVSGVVAGRATITVTARDPDGLAAAQSFEVTVQAAPSPDLVVQLSASAGSVAPGDGFTLNATVRNQGGGASSSTTLRYYRSVDARISTADALLDTAAVGRVEPSRTSTESLSVTAPSFGGTYYYGACIDALANESDRSNNCSDAFAVRVSQVNREPQSTGAISNRAVIVGGSVEVEISDNFTDPDGDALSFSAVSSDTLTAIATAANSTVNVTGVGVGSATITVAATDPGGLAATQSFAVSVEEETTPLPDLVVESPSVDVADSIEAGARFTLGADVRNRGAGDAAATTLRYYRSADATITTFDTEVGSDGVTRLVSGESTAETTAVTAPSDAGTYYFGACVDAVGNESNVANNCSGAVELGVWRRSGPPRAVGRIADGSVTVGNSISLDVASYFTDPDGDDLRYSVSSSAPDRARATNSGSSVTVTGVAQGSATITVAATDPGGLAATQSFDITVTALSQPDLVVQSASASVNTAAPSTSFTLTAVVRNQGAANLSSSTRVRFHRSSDATISTADAEIGDSPIGQLAASLSTTRSITATSPATPGTYYYGACVDAVAAESDGTNNCSDAVEVQVQQGNRAPQAVGTIGDQQIVLDGESSVDPASYFSDPDRDQLTYSAASSRPDTVSVEVDQGNVEFKGEALGRSTITVTASDPGGLTATQSFQVTVTAPPNRAPRVSNRVNDIPDAEVGDRYRTRLSIVFTDPDGDDLTYTTSNTDAAVAKVQLRNDSIVVNALAVGSTTMSITATDPGWLSATDSWDVTVVATVPDKFDIELHFASSVTESQKEHIRAARDSWESILAATELSDIAFNQEVDCFGQTATVGTVDDHLVLVRVTAIDGISGTLGQAGYCNIRTVGGVAAGPIVSAIDFDQADIQRVINAGSMESLAFHEMAHGLGFHEGYWEPRGVLDDDDTDPHFTGALAREAFDSAGGTSYTGNKVPVSLARHSHWRESVFDVEAMTSSLEVGTAQPISAITIQAMADIGYTVDVSLADDYDLPNPRPPGAVADKTGQVLDLSNDVVRGPVVVVGPDGRTIRVIPPPPGSPQFLRGPAREARIDFRPPRDQSNAGSLRPPTARGTFWRRDRVPASRPGPP